ncbi:MFS general substrate transporter [Patellaria atrata CBS 101060]|uniref:MFS general substrate transporter n=1 Tax=Patellaria atrata CBS 101060 TaxID=1346257 RepID=A0A9P4SE98_9PEZI|nr:MFS general substrate transporter [Patellaria atrata CBS 101060]
MAPEVPPKPYPIIPKKSTVQIQRSISEVQRQTVPESLRIQFPVSRQQQESESPPKRERSNAASPQVVNVCPDEGVSSPPLPRNLLSNLSALRTNQGNTHEGRPARNGVQIPRPSFHPSGISSSGYSTVRSSGTSPSFVIEEASEATIQHVRVSKPRVTYNFSRPFRIALNRGSTKSTSSNANQTGITHISTPHVKPKNEPESETCEISKWRWVFACLNMFSGALLYGIDTTIAVNIQGIIYQDLGSLQNLPWIGIGFFLGSAAVVLPLQKFVTLYNLKWMLLSSFVVFVVGNTLCGAAPVMAEFIVGRIIAGIGGVGVIIFNFAYTSIFTAPNHRQFYHAGIFLFWNIGMIVGPVIGGSFSDSSVSWRWSFYIIIIFTGAINFPISSLLMPHFQPPLESSTGKELATIDWLGTFLNTTVFTLFAIVVTFQGAIWSWKSPAAIVIWYIFGLSLIAHILQQIYSIYTSPTHRIFPVELLRSRTMILLFIVTSCATAALVIPLYYVPLLFQFTRGEDTLQTPIYLLPLLIPFVFTLLVTSAILPLAKLYPPFYLAGGILISIGGTIFLRITPSTSRGSIYGAESVMAIGAGLTFQSAYTIAAAKTRSDKAATAVSLISIAQVGSATIALTVAGTIFQNLGYHNLACAFVGRRFEVEELRGMLAGRMSPVLRGASEEIMVLALEAIVDTIAKGFALVVAAGGVMVLAAAGMRWERLKMKGIWGDRGLEEE